MRLGVSLYIAASMTCRIAETFSRLLIWLFGKFASESPNLKLPIIFYVIHIPGNIMYDAKVHDEIDLIYMLRTGHMRLRILRGTWPTTVERHTTADSVFNLASTSVPFQ